MEPCSTSHVRNVEVCSGLALTTFTAPWPSRSASNGSTSLHGPHQSAVKSTKTGWPCFERSMTSASKVSSELQGTEEVLGGVREKAALSDRRVRSVGSWRSRHVIHKLHDSRLHRSACHVIDNCREALQLGNAHEGQIAHCHSSSSSQRLMPDAVGNQVAPSGGYHREQKSR